MSASENTTHGAIAESDEVLPLTDSQLASLQALLEEARDALLGGIEDSSITAITEDASDDPAARLAARTENSALTQQMTEQMTSIDHALQRLADGEYGTCEVCGAAIPVERLEAVPSAVQCVACQ